jgi:Asp-tRNA(Asn)/Glu-tRNA(Gln) amidotransferase A subunit family amidase
MTFPISLELMHVGEIDTAVKGSPATHRAVLETVQALRAAGHECVEIDSPDCAFKN